MENDLFSINIFGVLHSSFTSLHSHTKAPLASLKKEPGLSISLSRAPARLSLMDQLALEMDQLSLMDQPALMDPAMEKLALTLALPRSRVYYIKAKKMKFKVTVTLRAARVESWIRAVKREFLDAATIKCVGLDYEFTDPREDNQRAAVL